MIENNKRQSRTVSCYVFAFMAILVFSLPAVVSATTLEIWDWWSPTVMGQAISTWWDHVEGAL